MSCSQLIIQDCREASIAIMTPAQAAGGQLPASSCKVVVGASSSLKCPRIQIRGQNSRKTVARWGRSFEFIARVYRLPPISPRSQMPGYYIDARYTSRASHDRPERARFLDVFFVASVDWVSSSKLGKNQPSDSPPPKILHHDAATEPSPCARARERKRN